MSKNTNNTPKSVCAELKSFRQKLLEERSDCIGQGSKRERSSDDAQRCVDIYKYINSLTSACNREREQQSVKRLEERASLGM